MSIKRVKLMINGQAHEVVADENLTLLDLRINSVDGATVMR